LSILKVSIMQIKAARMLLDWSQTELAKRSGVSEPTIKRLEASQGDLGGREGTREKIVAALYRMGIRFANGDEPAVKLIRQVAPKTKPKGRSK
jgi:predicted transcriptional regulator